MPDAIIKTIDLKAPIEKVWAAISDHEQFGTWFRVKLDAPFEVGEEARGHITYPGYEHIQWRSMTVAIEPPVLFAMTWRPYAIDPNVDYSGETPTRVEFRLEPIATGTRLTITESGFDKVPAHRRDEAFRMNEGGWAAQIDNIEAHVGG